MRIPGDDNNFLIFLTLSGKPEAFRSRVAKGSQ